MPSPFREVTLHRQTKHCPCDTSDEIGSYWCFNCIGSCKSRPVCEGHTYRFCKSIVHKSGVWCSIMLFNSLIQGYHIIYAYNLELCGLLVFLQTLSASVIIGEDLYSKLDISKCFVLIHAVFTCVLRITGDCVPGYEVKGCICSYRHQQMFLY